MTPKDVLKMAKEKGARIIDLRFIDLPGLWQHFSIPVSELSEGIFSDGLGFDGSSIRGFQTIDESDMLLIPDVSTDSLDPGPIGLALLATLRPQLFSHTFWMVFLAAGISWSTGMNSPSPCIEPWQAECGCRIAHLDIRCAQVAEGFGEVLGEGVGHVHAEATALQVPLELGDQDLGPAHDERLESGFVQLLDHGTRAARDPGRPAGSRPCRYGAGGGTAGDRARAARATHRDGARRRHPRRMRRLHPERA